MLPDERRTRERASPRLEQEPRPHIQLSKVLHYAGKFGIAGGVLGMETRRRHSLPRDSVPRVRGFRNSRFGAIKGTQ